MCPWLKPRDGAGSKRVVFLPGRPHGEERWSNDHSEKDRGENKIMNHKGSVSWWAAHVASTCNSPPKPTGAT